MEKDYLLNLLNKRKAELLKELQSSSAYIELEQVKRSIAGLTGRYSSDGDDLMIHYDDKKSYTRQVNAFKKDINNSPAAELPWGKRQEFMYDLIEQIVQDRGGELEIKEIERTIREDHNLPWHKNDRDNRVVGYVLNYNKTNEDNIRLGLWPNRQEGQKRVKRYEKVVLIKKPAAQT